MLVKNLKVLNKETKVLFSTLLVFLIIYCCGFLFPDYWWSTHFIAFISPILQLPILLGVLWLLFKMYRVNNTYLIKKDNFLINLKTIGLITILFMALTMIFAMVKDFYGDAYKFNSYLAKIPSVIPKGTNEKFLTFKLTPYAGEGTILAMITYIAYYFQVTYKTAFLIFDTVCGGLFVFTWLHFLTSFIKTNVWKIILGLAGVTAPFVLIFFGHIEVYAPIIFILLFWSYLTLLYIKTGKQKFLWLSVVVLLICLKLHSISLLCIPALFILLWKQFKGFYLNWKQVGMFIIVPIFIIGAILYFFVFEDHIDERSLQGNALAFDHIFLPLFSPEAPLDKYDLLSFNHFFDFFSLLLMWSPIALFLLVFFVISKRKKINWNAPEILISGLCLILFVAFFFVINPLLSMPIDWDLFSIPAPFLLVFVAAILIQLESEISAYRILTASKILMLLSLPVFIVHQSEKSLSRRLESVAIHVYSTYYEWTAKIVDNGFSLDDEYKVNRLSRGDALLEKLKPLAREGIDYEYSALLIDQGRYYMRVRKNPNKALILFDSAQKYAPTNNAKLLSLEAYFLKNDYEKAFEVSKELVQIQFPNPKKALKIFIHCSLEAGQYNESFEASKVYLKNWPEDTTVKEVLQRLSNNDRIGELKFLFQNVNR